MKIFWLLAIYMSVDKMWLIIKLSYTRSAVKGIRILFLPILKECQTQAILIKYQYAFTKQTSTINIM